MTKLLDDIPNDKHSAGLAAPATHAEIPVLDTDFAYVSRGIWCGAAGNLSVTLKSGDTAIFIGVLAGTLIPIRAKQVNTAGNTINVANLLVLS